MMKKFLAVLVVVAITAFSAVAFADVTMSGSVDVRSRAFTNLDLDKTTSAGSDRYTQSRVRLNMDAKVGDAKGRITWENDWETWGTEQGAAFSVESKQAQIDRTISTANGRGGFGLREAWLDTPLFGSVGIKAGHQFLQLGNGWFLRNMKYGDTAWLLYIPVGSTLIAFADAKINESANDNDSDFYAGLAVFKLGESTVGVDLSHVVLAKKHNFLATTAIGPIPTVDAENTVDNLGVNAAIAAGPVKLQIQADAQFGKKGDQTDVLGYTAEGKYKGNEIVIQGNANAGPAAINFTVARGSGDSWNNTSPDIKTYVNFLDEDPHVCVAYEYLIGQALSASASGNAVGAHQGFANTTAVSVGADFKAGDSLTVGGNVWYLMATKKILQDTTEIVPGVTYLTPSNDLGIEIDARVNWKLNDAVSWNWVLAYFMPGDAYKTLDYTMVTAGLTTIPTAKSPDKSTVIQGILSMKFQ